MNEKQFLYLSCILVAISSAAAVIVLKSFAHQVFKSTAYINRLLDFPYANSIFPIIGILLTIFVIRRFLNGSIQKGTAQIMIAVAQKSGIMPKKQMYSQIITSSLTVGMGGSAGLESPITITGAAFGSNYAQYYKFNYKNRTLLLACGVAAGIATAFNAPIAGVLFAIEVVLADMSVTAFIPLLLSAATGSIFGNIVFKDNFLFHFSKSMYFDYSNTIFYILLGVLGGLVSVYHARTFRKIEHSISNSSFGPYQKGLIGAGTLGIMIFIFPSLFGEGYESISMLASDNANNILNESLFQNFYKHEWLILILLSIIMLTKAIATGLTLGSGGNGGNFAPSLFVGSYLGYICAKSLHLLGFKDVPINNFTVVGMAAVLSGLFHAPLTAIFLIAEISGGYGLILPLMIVSSISFAISKRYDKYSMDIYSYADKGVVFTNDKDSNILNKIDIYTIYSKDISPLSLEATAQEMEYIFYNSNQVFIPILNKSEEVVGVVEWNDYKQMLLKNLDRSEAIHHVFKRTIVYSIYSNSKLLINTMNDQGSEYLILTDKGKYAGYITKATIMEYYRFNLQQLRIE